MQPWQILLIILAILLAALIVLYFVGKWMQKKQDAQKEQMEAVKQTATLLIIDKKRLPVKDSGLPQQVIDQVPKLMRRSKLPVVKVKYGPKIMTMIADENVYDDIPVRREIKATVSGIYITGVKAAHGKLDPKPAKQKKTFRQRILRLRNKAENELSGTEKASGKTRKKK